ncbi:UPF0481 protein At3g47200-like isoform X2 [Momordica charantia]|uniref:UPF0481 protein At3g47200-like isoform X2 n=1 Tax=Momordica charantia TaxID=3673 RepID=A0A6J1DXD6_MOMCH|nr:UPF0481 protein At3g47200-like isoform X2 [Momordica charantia]
MKEILKVCLGVLAVQNNKPYNNMHMTNVDEVCSSIKKMLQELPPLAEECNIHRVPRRLLKRNLQAYMPQIISIGPFHHGRQDLMPMEQHKLRFLDRYLRRTNFGIEVTVGIVRSWETTARNCYAEPINMDSDEFVKMMLVDGCFIVELMMMVCRIGSETETRFDPLLFCAMMTDLYCDLIMLENQLPFFVLQGLFDQFSLEAGLSFLQLTHMFYTRGPLIKPRTLELPHGVMISTHKVNHLVDFLSFYYAPAPASVSFTSHSLAISRKKCTFPPTVTELWEAGIVFKKAMRAKHIMDISFKDRVLQIPPLEIGDVFETYVRNLMAFEQYHNDGKYAIQYFLFLNGLISREQDVSLLVKANIITNCIGGNNQEVSTLFNDLCKDVIVRGDCNCFNHINEALHEHCGARWNKRMASLRRDYFNTPWAFISFVAAAFLILLTFLQTLFSAMSLSK